MKVNILVKALCIVLSFRCVICVYIKGTYFNYFQNNDKDSKCVPQNMYDGRSYGSYEQRQCDNNERWFNAGVCGNDNNNNKQSNVIYGTTPPHGYAMPSCQMSSYEDIQNRTEQRHPTNQNNYAYHKNPPANPYASQFAFDDLNLQLDEHLVDPYSKQESKYPYYPQPKTYSNYQNPQQIPGTPLNISQLNLASNELYNADINYMNNYLKSLPDYSMIAADQNINSGGNSNNNNNINNTINVQSNSNNANESETFNYSNYTSPLSAITGGYGAQSSSGYYSANQMQAQPQSQSAYPLSKSNSFQSFNMKPMTCQYNSYEIPPDLMKNKISRSTSSHTIPHHGHIRPSVQPVNNSFIGPMVHQTSGFQGQPLQKSDSNISINQNLAGRPPISGSKQSMSDFWKENLTSTDKHPKVGWNYSKIVSKSKDELQNTINKYKSNIASLNNITLKTEDDNNNTNENLFKLRKNYSYTHVESHLRDNLREDFYRSLYPDQARINYQAQQATAPSFNYYHQSGSAFNPIGNYDQMSNMYGQTTSYNQINPFCDATPPPPPGFTKPSPLMKSMSSVSVPNYLNSNPVPFGYNIQKPIKSSHIPLPIKPNVPVSQSSTATAPNDLSRSNSNSSLMQLPSVNLAELSSYLPQNLSKSASSSCIYAKTLSQPSHLRKTNDIFAKYQSFLPTDVSDANKTVSKNTDLMKNDIRPSIGLKPSSSFNSGVRPNVIFQRPHGHSGKAPTPIAKSSNVPMVSCNVPPNENLPPAMFSRGYSKGGNEPKYAKYEGFDYSKHGEKSYFGNDADCVVNLEDNIRNVARSIADVYDVGNNFEQIYGSSLDSKKSSGYLSDYKSNLNPEAKNFTPLSKSTTVKYIPAYTNNYTPCPYTPPHKEPQQQYHTDESSSGTGFKSVPLVRKIMRSNTITLNNPILFGDNSNDIKHERYVPLEGKLVENAVPPKHNPPAFQQTQQQQQQRDSNNNNNNTGSTYMNYQEDILRSFDPYFNAVNAVSNNIKNTPVTSNLLDPKKSDSSGTNKGQYCTSSTTDLLLDCDDIESDILDEDIDADDEDEGALVYSITDSNSDRGHKLKRSKKHSHPFSQSVSNEEALQVSETESYSTPLEDEVYQLCGSDMLYFIINMHPAYYSNQCFGFCFRLI